MYACSQSLSLFNFNKESPKCKIQTFLLKISLLLFLSLGFQAYWINAIFLQQFWYEFYSKPIHHLSETWELRAFWKAVMRTGQNERQKSMKQKYSVPWKTWHKYSPISFISAKLVICLTHISNFAWVTSRTFGLLSAKHHFSFWIAMKSKTTRKKIYFKNFKIVFALQSLGEQIILLFLVFQERHC